MIQHFVKSITEDLGDKELKSFRSDLVISSAVIEHVGSFDNQRKMIQNMIRLSKKYIVLTTPNKFHPIEFHTKLLCYIGCQIDFSLEFLKY